MPEEVRVNVSIRLEKDEVAGLESIAEGRASSVPEPVASRLLAMGLVRQPHEGTALELTPKGLSFIRSSDQ